MMPFGVIDQKRDERARRDQRGDLGWVKVRCFGGMCFGNDPRAKPRL